MNKLIIITILSFIISGGLATAQQFPPEGSPDDRMRGVSEKFKQMEKLKLIEVLKLDEQTAIRFFARRQKNMDEMKHFMDKRDSLIKVLGKKLESNEDDFKITVRNILDVERKIVENKSHFIENLGDLLTEKQIAKLILFENRFKREIKDYFFKRRRKMR